ncbi:hypothetical protein GRI75_06955 [Altererythrobacter soli]|uniref:ATP-grasp domain-containing protein n=1 Tax=Croceibacterium soli TaxID=1739690 RepID=A0A6I4UUF4_9SPHN|nr:hypothetical protein [Croceibacterium soli]MXP41379.1 hypothetical protein [Croceibacterium soli]
MTALDTSRPVILLGGGASTLAAARSLGAAGVPIIASGQAGCRAMQSRYCREARPVPPGADPKAFWRRMLIEEPEEALEGSVIFVGCDASLEFVESEQQALRQRYVVEEFVPELRRAMLDKLETLKLARSLGVPTPNFWEVRSADDVLALEGQITFPVMVKPLNSYRFMKQFGRKLFIVRESFAEAVEKVRICQAAGHGVLLVEMIPGPDDLLSSYYTYRTPKGHLLYDYTKSVIRRWPVNRGGACFHQSAWLPETAELGRRLFDGLRWQGIGNVEFKRDMRDGKLKIIEVNGRLTAGHPLVTRSGAPIDLLIYRYLTGQPVPKLGAYRQDVRQWDAMRDFLAYRQLSRMGKLTFAGWLRSIFAQKVILPFFDLRDPRPGLSEMWSHVSKPIAKRMRGPEVGWQNAD